MNWKTFALRFAGLIVIALAAGPLYALTMNLLIITKQIPEELIAKAYGNTLTLKCVYVWLVCLLAGFGSIFLKDSWRYILYFSPLYAPSVFSIIYTVIQ